MRENVWMGKLALPLLGSSFESHFCLASLSSEFLEQWKETHLHASEFIEYVSLTNTRRQHDYLLRNHCAKKVLLACLKKPLRQAKQISLDKMMTKQLMLTSNLFTYSHLQVGITHSETLGFAVAFDGRYSLGIDIEKMNVQKAQSIESSLFFSELKAMQTTNTLTETNLLNVWTAKESLCKALGGGLTVFSEITEVRAIRSYDHYTETHFKHFPGYRGYSFVIEGYVLTLVLPYSKRFQIDMNKLWQDLNINTNQLKREDEFIDVSQEGLKLYQ